MFISGTPTKKSKNTAEALPPPICRKTLRELSHRNEEGIQMNITLSVSGIPPVLILLAIDWLTGWGLSQTGLSALALASLLLTKRSDK